MRTSQVPQAEGPERVAQVGREDRLHPRLIRLLSTPGDKRLILPRRYPRVALRMAYPTTSPCESDRHESETCESDNHESENVGDEVGWRALG